MNQSSIPQHAQPDASAAPSAAHFTVRDLGRLAYGPALDEQRRVNQAVIDDQAPPTVLLVEHEPVITVSQRKNATQHLIAPQGRLQQLGIDVHETDRGGDITYHGPGQLVAYPIFKLNPLGLNLSRYMRWLEQVVIETLAHWRLEGGTEAGATGVWVASSNEHDANEQPSAKICAMGVRIRKNTTMHGLALNVDPNLEHFNTIVPCGLAGRAVTSMRQMLGEQTPDMATVKHRLIAAMDAAYAKALRE
jgi:lipoyl(octanoyl) transferase